MLFFHFFSHFQFRSLGRFFQCTTTTYCSHSSFGFLTNPFSDHLERAPCQPFMNPLFPLSSTMTLFLSSQIPFIFSCSLVFSFSQKSFHETPIPSPKGKEKAKRAVLTIYFYFTIPYILVFPLLCL
ncbi:hypothetical protein V8F06_001921 [Rhypophila decipiens]